MSKRSLKRLAVTALVCAVTVLGTLPAWAKPNKANETGSAVNKSSYTHVPVSLWLVPHVGTGGLASKGLETNLALSLGASGYARLRGLDLGVGGSWITEQMTGAQGTIGLNYVGQDARGAQLTVGANLVRGQMQGLQGAVGGNYTGGDMRGVQLAVGTNLTLGNLTGLQASSGYNHAGGLRGAQVGIINYGGGVTGTQVGIINIGRKVRGAQIGLVNLGEEVDAPIGLLNLVRDGQHHLDLWSSDTAPLNVGIKLGGKHVYTLLTAGFQPKEDKKRWMVGLGLGGHIPIGERFFFNTDLVSWHVNEDEAWTDEINSLNKLRLIGGYRVHQHFSVFAGASLNVLVTRVDDGSDFGLFRGRRVTSDSSETAVRIWPGFLAGIQI